MTQTVEMPTQTRAAPVTSVDDEKRTVRLVFTTGAQVKRFSWNDGEFIEELSLDPDHVRLKRLNSGAALLDSHGSGRLANQIGVIEKAWIDGKEGLAEVRFSKREAVEPFWNDVKDGIIRNVSVGYFVHKFEDRTKKGETIKRLVAVDWEPVEISLVAVPADPKAKIREDDALSRCIIESPDEEWKTLPHEELGRRFMAGMLPPEEFPEFPHIAQVQERQRRERSRRSNSPANSG